MKIRFFASALILLLGCATPALALLKTGEQAPDFSARTLEDKTLKLSDFKGKPLLIEMGTTWCPSCTDQAKQINRMRDYLKKKGVSYISVYLADSAESIGTHIKDYKLEPADITMIDSGEARRNYNVFSIPRLLLIDKNFEIVFDEMFVTGKELKRRINDLTEQRQH
jgi:peroxiredoxin